jgi:drug/metabolite transporter (DMT)-like permease
VTTLPSAIPSGLSGGVVAITLFAAVLHATWNAVAHGVPDRLVGFALIGVAYVVVPGIGVLVLGLPPSGAWPFVLASAGLHVVYMLLLWWSYQLGDFSQVYPVARGTAPWVVAVIEVVLGHGLPPLQLAGVVVISFGLVSLALDGRRLARATLPALGAAVATGVAIAAYTVVDASAVSTTSVLLYASWTFLLQGPVMPVIALVRRGRGLWRTARPVAAAGLAGGVVSLAAYGLVLVAQTSGATAAVAALRETSIVFGAIIGAVFLGEGFGLRRVVAAVVVAAGIVLVNV